MANVETGLAAHPNNSLHGPKHQACRSYPAKILAHLKKIVYWGENIPTFFCRKWKSPCSWWYSCWWPWQRSAPALVVKEVEVGEAREVEALGVLAVEVVVEAVGMVEKMVEATGTEEMMGATVEAMVGAMVVTRGLWRNSEYIKLEDYNFPWTNQKSQINWIKSGKHSFLLRILSKMMLSKWPCQCELLPFPLPGSSTNCKNQCFLANSPLEELFR